MNERLLEMYKPKSPRFRLKGDLGDKITLELVKKVMTEHNEENFGLTLTFKLETIKVGGFFSKKTEDCLTIIHPEYEYKYEGFRIKLGKQGKITVVEMNRIGESEQVKRELKAMNSSGVGGLIRNVSAASGRDGFEQECTFYNMVDEIFAELFQDDGKKVAEMIS